jgi:transcriptional regulator GlxA family with amidase domain
VTSPRSRIRRLVEWILEDPARPQDNEHLAHRAAMSPRNLSRIFVQETGTTPARFVEQARIGLARRLLERSGVRVAWVAARAGFESAERMRRAFHRELSMSPRDYASVGSGTIRR